MKCSFFFLLVFDWLHLIFDFSQWHFIASNGNKYPLMMQLRFKGFKEIEFFLLLCWWGSANQTSRRQTHHDVPFFCWQRVPRAFHSSAKTIFLSSLTDFCFIQRVQFQQLSTSCQKQKHRTVQHVHRTLTTNDCPCRRVQHSEAKQPRIGQNALTFTRH